MAHIPVHIFPSSPSQSQNSHIPCSCPCDDAGPVDNRWLSSISSFVLLRLALSLLDARLCRVIDRTTMLSPSFSSGRAAPPIRPSQSLEGLEQVVPPKIMYFAPHRSEIFFNKPLPAAPMPDEDPTEYSAMWSDSSSDYESESGSTLASLASPSSPSEPRKSIESYPIFVSGSKPDDDLDDLNDLDLDDPSADPAVVGEVGEVGSLESSSPPQSPRTDSIDLDASSIILGTNAHYGRPLQWAQQSNGSNHYFRDKTWHFFPELAAPNSRQTAVRANSTSASTKTKKEGRLNVAGRRRRWYSFNHTHMGRPTGVRDSIKSYVNKTLSRDATEDKEKETGRQRSVTTPIDPMLSSRTFLGSGVEDEIVSPKVLEIDTQLANTHVTAVNSSSYENPRASPTTPQHKHLAVPMSPYQRFGPSIWENSSDKSADRILVVPPQTLTPSSSFSHHSQSSTSPTAPIPSPLKVHLQQSSRGAVRALQGSSLQMRGPLSSAKKKERRREELKSQIRLVGTVNPHTYGKADPWSPA